MSKTLEQNQPKNEGLRRLYQWRPMEEADVPFVKELADRVHVAFPEDEAVFAERLALYPAGCFVLGNEGRITGYVVAHPWRLKDPPALNSLLAEIPEDADTFYIHDIALLTEMRGVGAAEEIVARLVALAVAEGFETLSLTAVNDSMRFWEKQDFFVVSETPAHLASYGEGAWAMVRHLLRRVPC